MVESVLVYQGSVGPNMAVVPLPVYKTFWTRKRKTLKGEFQDLVSKHPDAEAQLRQLFGVFCYRGSCKERSSYSM
jgi:hypothetical protein